MYRGLGNIARAPGRDDGIVFFEKILDLARGRHLQLLEAETRVDYVRLRRDIGGDEEACAYLQYACGLFDQRDALLATGLEAR
jgi:hypothetical protein